MTKARDYNQTDNMLLPRTRELEVDGFVFRTNLTDKDLEDPKFWTLRSPKAWAEAIRKGGS